MRMTQTFFGIQRSIVFDVQIRESAMYMNADLLAGLCSPEDPDDRYF